MTKDYVEFRSSVAQRRDYLTGANTLKILGYNLTQLMVEASGTLGLLLQNCNEIYYQKTHNVLMLVLFIKQKKL